MLDRVLIFGAGGHGQVVADILLNMHEAGHAVKPIGFVDDEPQTHGKSILGLPILGSLTDIASIEHDKIIIGIGQNRLRMEKFNLLKKGGAQFAIAQHPKAVVAQNVTIAPGSMIMAGVIINTGTTIAENTILNSGCTVDHHSTIAEHVHIAPGVHMGGEVHVQTGAFIGIGATVLPQRTIGSWSTVGAGALVLSHVPNELTVVGIPAKPINPIPTIGY